MLTYECVRDSAHFGWSYLYHYSYISSLLEIMSSVMKLQ